MGCLANLHLRKNPNCSFLFSKYSCGKLAQIIFVNLWLAIYYLIAKKQDMNAIGWYAFCEHLFILILNFASIMSGVFLFYGALFHPLLELFNLFSILVLHFVGLIIDSNAVHLNSTSNSNAVHQNSTSNSENTPQTHQIIEASSWFDFFQKFYYLLMEELPANDVLITFPLISLIAQAVFILIMFVNWIRRQNTPNFQQPEEYPFHVFANGIPNQHLPPLINNNIQLHGNAPNPPQGQNQPRLPAPQVPLHHQHHLADHPLGHQHHLADHPMGHQHRPVAPISVRQHRPKAPLGHQHRLPAPLGRKPLYAAAAALSQQTRPISSLSQEAGPSSSSSSKSRSITSSRGSETAISLDKDANPAGFQVQSHQKAASLNRQSSSVSMDKSSSLNISKNQPFLSMGSLNRPSSMASLNRLSSSVTDMSQFSFVAPLNQAQRSAGNSNLVSNKVETRYEEVSSESDSSIKFEKSEEASLIKRNRSSTPSPEISSPEDNDEEEKLISQEHSISKRMKNLSNDLKTIICEMK